MLPEADARVVEPQWLLNDNVGHRGWPMFEGTEVYGIFVRILGLLFAFQLGSTGSQLLPLIGSRGIEPIAHLVAAFRRDHGAVGGFFKLPTLFWLSSSDSMIRWLPRVGALLGLLIAAGVLGDV